MELYFWSTINLKLVVLEVPEANVEFTIQNNTESMEVHVKTIR